MIIRNDGSHQKILRQLQKSQHLLIEQFKRASTGNRINSGADDSAGLRLSERLTRHNRGDSMGNYNIRTAKDLLEAGDGGMESVKEHLFRMRELAVQSANGTYTSEERAAMQKEFAQLEEGVEMISRSLVHNGVNVLDRSQVHSGTVPAAPPPLVGSVFESPLVADNGNFRFKTHAGFAATALDDNLRLVWNAESPSGSLWSRPSVRVGGSQYFLRDHLDTPTVLMGGHHVTEFFIAAENVRVIQRVRPVGELIEIHYSVQNMASGTKNIGFQFHIDTRVGDDDDAPYTVGGVDIPPTGSEREYTGGSVPSDFTIYNTSINPDIKAHAVLAGAGVIQPPDRLGIGSYSQTFMWNWTPDSSITDSSYALWWNERSVGGGGLFAVNTFYGITPPPTIPSPGPPLPVGNDGMIVVHHGMEDKARTLLKMADIRSSALGIDLLDISGQSDAEASIAAIDRAMDKVSGEQVRFGGYIRRLDALESGNVAKGYNSSRAKQRIEEADIAKTVSELAAETIRSETNYRLLTQSQAKFDSLVQMLKS